MLSTPMKVRKVGPRALPKPIPDSVPTRVNHSTSATVDRTEVNERQHEQVCPTDLATIACISSRNQQEDAAQHLWLWR